MFKTRILQNLISVINGISRIISYLYKYRTVYKITGLFATRRFPKAEKQHKYAILIAARNEEAVIGNLLESIRCQDYPKDLIDIFTVADNCTDSTAAVAREHGAVCYEREDKNNRTKGYALQFLVENIKRDYGILSYDGYFIFDADNLLQKDYVSRMNEAFDAGEKIVTSYRSTKNFSDNWISASYALHWLRTIRNEHRARSFFHLATRIQGTGFLFASEFIKDGWNYTGLTEDRAFCADAVANGYSISYNNDAIFYDEQPTELKIALRQRIRWAKGHLQALRETGGKLFCNILLPKSHHQYRSLPFYKRIFEGLRQRFMSFDMLTVVFPRSLFTLMKRTSIYWLRLLTVLLGGKIISVSLAPDFIKWILNIFNISLQNQTEAKAIIILTAFTFAWSINSYLNGILTAIYIFLTERQRIEPIPLFKKIWFCITFPIFDIIGKISMLIALFKKVDWKPIPHTCKKSISQIETK